MQEEMEGSNHNSIMEKTMPPPATKHKMPHRYTQQGWDSNYVREACEKSMAALESSKVLLESGGGGHGLSHLIRVKNVENLFFINNKGVDYALVWWSSNDASMAAYSTMRAWGDKDIMLDLGIHGCLTREQRSEYLRDAASFSGGAVYLLELYNLPEEEASDWLQDLSVAADHDAEPRTLFIRNCRFKTFDLLKTLRKCKGLRDLSLQFWESITDDCVEMLSGLPSIATLHIDQVKVSPDFVGKLADLRPSHSPLAASLQRLDIQAVFTEMVKPGWAKRSFSGFLQHWPKLEELTLVPHSFTEEDLIDFMDLLAQSKKIENNTPAAADLSASPSARLYSLTLGKFPNANLELRRTVAAVVDGLSRSSLPFLELEGVHKMDPAIEAQLLMNQRMFILGDYLEKVPANSMRLFICGDPYAGKTTLLSTMHSMNAGETDNLRSFQPNRTQGIQVRAMTEDGIRLSLWDMAGQQEFHAFHDCMFPDIGTSSYQTPSMFMFVWSPMHSETSKKGRKKEIKEFEDSFRYWLKFLASKSRQSNVALKVILVLTRMDQMELVSRAVSSSINSLRSEFKEVIHIINPALEVDARQRDSVKPVLECIFHTAKEMLQGVEVVYDICTQVSEHLSKYMKTSMQRIIRCSEFRDICECQLSIPHDEAKLKTIALSLNESGIIIYVNNIAHIVLDPNWFCNQIIGSLIHLAESKQSKGTMEIRGFTHRDFLEAKLESITKSQVKGSLLVELMEAMHLCCRVTIDPFVPSSNVDHIFIPTLLIDGSRSQELQWRSTNKHNVDDYTFVYMGRRLECEDKNHTFLTPGLFPRVQVLFNKAFQSLQKEYKPDVMLGKDFISICFPNKEIIVVFCQAKSEHVIDVLVRANNTNNNQHHKPATLVDMELKCIINTLVTICAQPTGIQGVKLIESVFRPDSLHDPSKAQDREGQCVEIIYLKEQLRTKLLQGEPESYEWKWTTQTPYPLQNNFIDLLGSENYREVLISCQAWLKETTKYLYAENDEINVSREQQYQQNMTTKSLENSLLQHLEDQILEEATDVEVRSIKVMAKVISILNKKLDANHNEVLGEVDKMRRELHEDFQCLRKDVITNIEKSLGKLLRLAMENEQAKQLPQVAILTTIDDKNIKKFVTSMLGISLVEIHLYCEDPTLPHPVENQPGIALTSWLQSHRDRLEKALPYINGFFVVLTKAIGLGINQGGF